MTFRDEIRDAMTLAASTCAGDVRMGRTVRDYAADVMLEADIIACMSASVSLILALEEQQDATKAAIERARDALRDALEATTGQVRAGAHTASTSAGPASVVITDDAAIPPRFMEQPPPRADKAAIARALKAGEVVPGAALRNSQPVLRIRTNVKDTAA